MSDPTHASFDELELRLQAMASRVTFPATPDFADRVRTAIAQQTAPSPVVLANAPKRSWQKWAVAACIALVGISVLLALLPGVRASVARYLGLPGIEIVVVDGTATAVPTASGDGLLLGERMSLDTAQAQVDYPIQIPAELGAPDEVFVRQIDNGQMVTLLYYPREDLPNTVESGVGALLMQFPASDDPGSLAKRVFMGIGRVIDVDVNGETAFWVTGETQMVLDQDPSRGFDDLIARDAGNVLLWGTDSTTYRLESALKLSDSLAVAESVPVPLPEGTATP